MKRPGSAPAHAAPEAIGASAPAGSPPSGEADGACGSTPAARRRLVRPLRPGARAIAREPCRPGGRQIGLGRLDERGRGVRRPRHRIGQLAVRRASCRRRRIVPPGTQHPRRLGEERAPCRATFMPTCSMVARSKRAASNGSSVRAADLEGHALHPGHPGEPSSPPRRIPASDPRPRHGRRTAAPAPAPCRRCRSRCPARRSPARCRAGPADARSPASRRHAANRTA